MQEHDAFSDLQWFGPRTRGSNVVDVLFGVLLPILLFAVFTDMVWQGIDVSPLRAAPLAVYLFAGATVLAMLAWVTYGGRSPHLDAVLAGAFLPGFLVALTIAVFTLPLVIFLFILSVAFLFTEPQSPGLGVLAVLSLTPWGTAFVCFRAATRGLGAVTPAAKALRAVVAAAIVLVLAIAYQVAADRMLDQAAFTVAFSSEPREVREAVARIERWRPLVPRREFARRALDSADRGYYRQAYQAVTGSPAQSASGGGWFD